jgi:hypothetical protein
MENLVKPMNHASEESYPEVNLLRRALMLAGIVGLMAFGVACGSSSSSKPPITGKFTNASLQGQYAYALTGQTYGLTSGNGPFREAGSLTADGNGNITTGNDDFVSGTGPSTNPTNGTYALNNDGTGVMVLNVAGGQINFAISMIDSTKFYLIEMDTFANSAGMAERQSSSSFTNPSGTYVYRMHSTSTSQGSVARLGTLTMGGGAVTGNEDLLQGSTGALSSLTLTGSTSAPDLNGRGTASFTDNTGITNAYVYYVVDSNRINFLESDAGPVGSGRGEKQTTSSFAAASLNGAFAFGSRGDTVANLGGANSVGAFSSNGGGTISSGAYDTAQDGNIVANAALTGSYTMGSNGRAVLTLNPSGGTPVQVIAWLLNSSRGFYLFNTTSRVEDGTFDQQSSNSFANSSFSGQYAFFNDGYDAASPPLISRAGTIIPDGKGNISLNDFAVNRTGSLNNAGFLTGTYSTSSNGRVAGPVNGLTNALVIYMVSSSQGYLLLGDAGAEVAGQVALQTSP